MDDDDFEDTGSSRLFYSRQATDLSRVQSNSSLLGPDEASSISSDSEDILDIINKKKGKKAALKKRKTELLGGSSASVAKRSKSDVTNSKTKTATGATDFEDDISELLIPEDDVEVIEVKAPAIPIAPQPRYSTRSRSKLSDDLSAMESTYNDVASDGPNNAEAYQSIAYASFSQSSQCEPRPPATALIFCSARTLRAAREKLSRMLSAKDDLEVMDDLSSSAPGATEGPSGEGVVVLVVEMPNKQSYKFRVKKDEKFDKLLGVLKQLCVMAPEDADFTLKFDGLVVDPNSTPDKEYMDDNSRLVLSWQIGTTKPSPPLQLRSSSTVTSALYADGDLVEIDKDSGNTEASSNSANVSTTSAATRSGDADASHLGSQEFLTEEERRFQIELEEKLRKQQEAAEAAEAAKDKIKLKIRINEKVVRVSMKKIDPFTKLVVYMAQELGVPPAKVSLTFDGMSIPPKSTPNDHDLEDDDQIDASAKQ